MKKISIFLFFLAIALVVHAQDKLYRVRLVKGEVVHANNQQEVKEGESLNENETLKLSDQSFIQIVDKDNYVYTYKENKTIKVKEILEVRKKSFLSLVFKAFYYQKDVVNKDGGVIHRDVTKRGSTISFDLIDLDTHERIKKIRVSANTAYYFRLTNNNQERLYYNLIRTSCTNDSSVVLFDKALPIDKSKEIDLQNWAFCMPENVEYTFHVIASPQPIMVEKIIDIINITQPVNQSFTQSRNKVIEELIRRKYPEVNYIWKELFSN